MNHDEMQIWLESKIGLQLGTKRKANNVDGFGLEFGWHAMWPHESSFDGGAPRIMRVGGEGWENLVLLWLLVDASVECRW